MPKAARNVLYLYMQGIVSSGAGYAFWLLVSRLTSPSIVGFASVAVVLGGIGASFACLGVPTGIRRFVGKNLGENGLRVQQRYLGVSLRLVGVGVAVVSSLLAIVSGLPFFPIMLPFEFLIVVIISLATSSLAWTLTGAFVAALRLKILFLTQLLASLLRIGVGVSLVLIGMGALGILLGNAMVDIVSLGILGSASLLDRRNARGSATVRVDKGVARELLQASLVSWLPSIASVLGMNLGILAVFGASGAAEAGLYFIAFAILSIITGIYSSITGIAFPILSGMSNGRKMMAWRATRLSLVFCIPPTAAIIAYPRAVLGLFGAEYAAADTTLSALLLSVLPLIISGGVNTLAYAYGNYRQVLAMGLAGNVPTIILYPVLTAPLGGLGSASAYLVGAFCSGIFAVIVARRIKMQIIWSDISKVILVPAGIGLVAFATKLDWMLGASALTALSFLAYARLNVLTRLDVRTLAEAALPENIAKMLSRRLGRILTVLYGKQD